MGSWNKEQVAGQCVRSSEEREREEGSGSGASSLLTTLMSVWKLLSGCLCVGRWERPVPDCRAVREQRLSVKKDYIYHYTFHLKTGYRLGHRKEYDYVNVEVDAAVIKLMLNANTFQFHGSLLFPVTDSTLSERCGKSCRSSRSNYGPGNATKRFNSRDAALRVKDLCLKNVKENLAERRWGGRGR